MLSTECCTSASSCLSVDGLRADPAPLAWEMLSASFASDRVDLGSELQLATFNFPWGCLSFRDLLYRSAICCCFYREPGPIF